MARLCRSTHLGVWRQFEGENSCWLRPMVGLDLRAERQLMQSTEFLQVIQKHDMYLDAARKQGSRSYAFCIDFFAEVQLAHLNKTKSCEVEVATGKSESDVIRVAAGAFGPQGVRSAMTGLESGVLRKWFPMSLPQGAPFMGSPLRSTHYPHHTATSPRAPAIDPSPCRYTETPFPGRPPS